MKKSAGLTAAPAFNIVALLGALCFFFSTIEYMIPKPLPFLRLGLANLPIMLGMELLTVPQLILVVFIKILGQGLIGGTLFSYIFLFSAAGTIASACVMIVLRKAFPRLMSYTGISTAGALASNAVQLLLARYIIFGVSAWLIAPPFIALGTVTSVALGMFTNYFVIHSRWLAEKKAQLRGFVSPSAVDTPSPVQGVSGQSPGVREIVPPLTIADSSVPDVSRVANPPPAYGHPLTYFFIGLAILLVLFFAPNLYVTGACFILILILFFTSGKKTRLLPVLLMSFSIIIFNLLAPSGLVLFSAAGLPVTLGSLLTGIKKALTVEGMIFLSRWMIRPGLTLPGKPGQLVSRSFELLELLSERKTRFDSKHIIASIDDILMSLPG